MSCACIHKLFQGELLGRFLSSFLLHIFSEKNALVAIVFLIQCGHFWRCSHETVERGTQIGSFNPLMLEFTFEIVVWIPYTFNNKLEIKIDSTEYLKEKCS